MNTENRPSGLVGDNEEAPRLRPPGFINESVAPRAAVLGIAVNRVIRNPPVLVVNERGYVVHVPLSDVLYLKAELKYVTLRTSLHSYVLDDSLSQLEEQLGSDFLRVHRNALVSRKAVRAVQRRDVVSKGDDEGAAAWAVCIAPIGEWLTISRRQVAAVRQALLIAGH
jgi:two-component system response regulator AlgR